MKFEYVDDEIEEQLNCQLIATDAYEELKVKSKKFDDTFFLKHQHYHTFSASFPSPGFSKGPGEGAAVSRFLPK